MNLLLCEYVKLIVESSELSKQWNFFHLSENDLGETFKFVPRLPRSPYKDMHGNVIEDMTTPRTSWARTIRDAINALQGFTYGDLYVYAVEDIPDIHDCEEHFLSGKCPSSPGNDYGYGFLWKKYEEHFEKKRKKKITDVYKAKKLRGCVPDALDTHEVWSLTPIIGTKIGIIKNGKFIGE